jgi:hypothetical protein
MATVWPLTRGFTRGFFVGGVACLFLLQALAFVFSSNGRIAFASGDGGASIAMAGEICHAGDYQDFRVWRERLNIFTPSLG